MGSLAQQLIINKHELNKQKEMYKLQSAQNMIQTEAEKPGTYDPAMIQMAADTMGLAAKQAGPEHEGAFHRALGHVLPHIFGKPKPTQPPNEGAMSSGGSAAPQAAMVPQLPAPPSTAPNLASPIMALNSMMPPPPSQASADSSLAADAPLPGIDRGGPALGPRMASAPSEGYTSLGIGNNPAVNAPTAPAPAAPMLRNGPTLSPPPFHVNTLAERVAANAPGARAQAALDTEITAQKREATKQWLEQQSWYKSLSPRQQAIVSTNISLTPELRPTRLPGKVKGSLAPEGQLDYRGDPVDRSGKTDYDNLLDPGSGEITWIPTSPNTTTRTWTDPATGKSWLLTMDRQGNEVSRTPAVDPRLLQTETSTANSSSAPQVRAVGDKLVVTAPITTTRKSTVTTGKRLPGAVLMPPEARASATAPLPESTSAPVAVPIAAPVSPRAAATTTSTGNPMISKVIGDTPAAWAKKIENPLTSEGQKFMVATDTTIDTVDRVAAMLKEHQKEGKPARLFLPQIAYSLGFKGGESELLGALSMGSIIEGGRVMAPTGSRARSILEKAMLHTPNAWTDSVPLMLDKLTAVKKSLNESKTNALNYYRKYPGLNQGGNGAMTPPPGERKPLADIFK